MSYSRRALGMPAPFTSTTAFAQSVDPYTWRTSPPGAIYSPYGWGPDMTVGMPMSYSHHINYVPSMGAVSPTDYVGWKDAMRVAQWKDAVRSTQWKDAMRSVQRPTRQMGPMYDKLSAMGNYARGAAPSNRYILYHPDQSIPIRRSNIPRNRYLGGLGSIGLLAIL